MVSKEKALVHFDNIEEVYLLDGKPAKIEYFVDPEYETSTKDWIGIYPKGWRDLSQLIIADYAITKTSKENKQKKILQFYISCLLKTKMNFYNSYQFVYISQYMQVIGRSNYFRLQRKGNGMLLGQNQAEVYEGTGTGQISMALSNLHMNGMKPSPSIVQTVNCSGVGFPLVKPYRSETVLPYHAKEYISSCQYCSKVLQKNFSLIDQVKNIALINRQLNQSLSALQHKFELSIAAQKKLKLWCFALQQDKQNYEVFVRDLFKCLQDNNPVCVRDSDKGSEMIVRRINTDANIQQASHYPIRHTSSINERYLKAVIGAQEIKIQELSKKLQDLGKKLELFELNSQRKISKTDLLEIDNKKHDEFDKYNNYDSANKIEVNKNNVSDSKEGTDESYNGFNDKFEKAIINIASVEEKLEAIICDVNNNSVSDEEDLEESNKEEVSCNKDSSCNKEINGFVVIADVHNESDANPT